MPLGLIYCASRFTSDASLVNASTVHTEFYSNGSSKTNILLLFMQTLFTAQQLTDPVLKESERILRKCVHCGFCLSTCPTYQILGDELDSPRGRIYLIKDMLENNRVPSENVVKHIDRCLSCLACVSSCPSDVNYMHLIDHARGYIEKNFRRSLYARCIRSLLALVLPVPKYFRLILVLAKIANVFRRFLPQQLNEMTQLARTNNVPNSPGLQSGFFSAEGRLKGKVGLIPGCVQQVIGNHINKSTVQLLNRLGYDVHMLVESQCCGAIEHHLGKVRLTAKRIENNVTNWLKKIEQHDLDAIVINASGCGTMVKDYHYLLRENASLCNAANIISSKARDITEFIATCNMDNLSLRTSLNMTVAYHSACSLQHGQKISHQPVALLEKFGFKVIDIPESHMCCGSAGTYNLLQADLANQLGQRKAVNINSVKADVVASGNLGCINQLENYLEIPIVHTVELLDWACGGEQPARLRHAL